MKLSQAQNVSAVVDYLVTMRDEDHCMIRMRSGQTLHHYEFGLGIESRTEFVQQKDAARTQEAACYGYALGLSLGQTGSCLETLSVQSSRELKYEISRSSMQSGIQLFFCSIWITHKEIVPDSAAEQTVALRNVDEIATRSGRSCC